MELLMWHYARQKWEVFAVITLADGSVDSIEICNQTPASWLKFWPCVMAWFWQRQKMSRIWKLKLMLWVWYI
ncbi:hypothetical protein RHMOL_Rhmol09G0197300 [Rhododendron molle]|uniref:Uncharacterized protein n=1 Tax=Rhododendron molle TaxID=49168 RepID=A0ACC0MGD4_RHOML|nr:hypothetical protein RHMOL_Rhmol09G0197300 [Rhododendron molle]